MNSKTDRLREIPVGNFATDILKVLKKHQKYTDDAGILVNELIQICCGLSFEFRGNVLGRMDLIEMIDVCFEYSKNEGVE